LGGFLPIQQLLFKKGTTPPKIKNVSKTHLCYKGSGDNMALAIPNVTFEKITENSQKAVYNILKNNIAITVSKLKGRATIEVYKKKDFPLIEVGMPMQEEILREKIEYNHKKIKLLFEINAYTREDAKTVQLADLVQYTLDSNRDDLHSASLYKFNPEGMKHSFEWDGIIEKKVYKSTFTFSVIWSGE